MKKLQTRIANWSDYAFFRMTTGADTCQPNLEETTLAVIFLCFHAPNRPFMQARKACSLSGTLAFSQRLTRFSPGIPQHRNGSERNDLFADAL
jgi:hypothetical protein